MLILVDMDGVIADFEEEFLKRWRANHSDKPYVPHEERKGHYIIHQYPEEYKQLVYDVYHSPGFYQSLPEVKGAFKAINEMVEMGHNVFLCTAPMLPRYDNCVLEKYHWVNEHLGEQWVNKIILAADKTIVKGDILIDDNPVIKGSITPEWEHVVYDQAYNRDIVNQRRLTWDNWKEVLGL